MLEALLRKARHSPGPRGRYAPSPSGAQHLGNARTALLAWLQTRLQGGTFVMRMEDLDHPRVVPGSARQILQELEWMGLDWDEGAGVGGPSAPYEQSARGQLYSAAVSLLEQQGHLFKCICTRRDINAASSAPHGSSAVYPGTCRTAAIPPGRRFSWRFRATDETVKFVDEIAGPFAQNVSGEVGDFVIRRADGLFAYQLAVVVDDALMGITDVVRGADLLDSAPRQMLLYRALEAPPPTYWHVPLMLDDKGRRMSKRQGSPTIEAYRAAGGTSRKLIGQLAASVGLVHRGAALTPSELLNACDLGSFKRRLRTISKGNR